MLALMPAVAFPLVTETVTRDRQVSAEELREAFRFNDGQRLTAEDINLRFGLLIDMLFEPNPARLRYTMHRLVEMRKTSDHIYKGRVIAGEPPGV
jgi:hypothetical protein